MGQAGAGERSGQVNDKARRSGQIKARVTPRSPAPAWWSSTREHRNDTHRSSRRGSAAARSCRGLAWGHGEGVVGHLYPAVLHVDPLDDQDLAVELDLATGKPTRPAGSIRRAARALANVPVSQPAAAPTTWSNVVACSGNSPLGRDTSVINDFVLMLGERAGASRRARQMSVSARSTQRFGSAGMKVRRPAAVRGGEAA